ncbi:hypothetical protein Ocin01_00431 [Orchesella cincta]|uniref:Uncharacterized protein n=1 Tax=Orchesella cincta TaxID=48709 RepID=A0A1D2NLZ2_ORCCI|nr:hypothetical protein Ocin01_00431 [Orchesella cincta]
MNGSERSTGGRNQRVLSILWKDVDLIA